MISIRELSVQVPGGRTLLESIDLEVPAQSVLGVFGPNGSGKSTLLKSLSGHHLPDGLRGEVSIAGIPLTLFSTVKERTSRILYLGSDFRAPFDLRVSELFELGVQATSSSLWPEVSPSDRNRIANVVESLGILEFLPRSFQTLSDGEKQLMMFARALIQAPRVLVLDETFSKLDLDRLISVTKIIRAWTQCGMSFLIASHDLNFLSEISDQLLFLKKGKKVALGPVDSVIRPENLKALFDQAAPEVVFRPGSGKRKIVY
jgi:iron complex transport system ATP-binding protein